MPVVGVALGQGNPPSGEDPQLTMGSPAPQPDGLVTVPISFTANGAQIANLVFAVDYDGARLALDPTDADQDGMPDAVVVHVPKAFRPSITIKVSEPGGELEVVVAAMQPPLPALPDGELMTITFQPLGQGVDLSGAVRFAASPAVSMGSTDGRAVQAKVVDPTTVEPLPQDTQVPLVGVAVAVAIVLTALYAWWRWRRQHMPDSSLV